MEKRGNSQQKKETKLQNNELYNNTTYLGKRKRLELMVNHQ